MLLWVLGLAVVTIVENVVLLGVLGTGEVIL